MSYPVRFCAICGEEFELKPDKPGFANHCPDCSASEAGDPGSHRTRDASDRQNEREMNEARRKAMRDLLYRKDS